MISVYQSEIDTIKELHEKLPDVKKFSFDGNGRLIGVEYLTPMDYRPESYGVFNNK